VSRPSFEDEVTNNAVNNAVNNVTNNVVNAMPYALDLVGTLRRSVTPCD
jgi:hypothetical protein